MGLFDQFPYTNFHELNLMWILEALKEIQTTTEQFVALNSLKYADPIQWNIVKQYEKNTIVIDPQTGTAYISVQPVPTGVALTNEDYWTVVFDLGSFVTRAAKNFTTRYEADTTLTATFNTEAGQWLVWGDTLYKAARDIIAGDQYTVDSNIIRITAEEIKDEIYTTFNGMIGDLADLNTTDHSNLVAAINEVVQALSNETTRVDNITGSLDDLDTTDKSNLVAAINEVDSKADDLDEEKLSFIIGDVSIIRHDYGNYVIEVLKLAHDNQDGSKNIPYCKGKYDLEGMEVFSEGTKLAINAGFYDAANKMQGNTISNGSVITGNVISSPAVCYLGFDDNGDFHYYDQTTPMADIIADGCDNAILAWCPLIENHALSPNILSISQTSQQNIGVDDDLNYYIITTSYYCPLDIQGVANWILANYPEIKTCFAVDSGGSAQTRVYNIMTNTNSDLNRQYGRQIPSAICFPITSEQNDITSILNIIRETKENVMPQVIYNSGSHTQIGTKVQMSFFNSYQVGNIFFGSGVVELEDGYDGSWVRLTVLENYLPSPDRHSYFPLICHYNVTNNGRMDINPSSDEMNIKPTIEVKGPANSSGSSRLYDVTIIYAVKQMR